MVLLPCRFLLATAKFHHVPVTCLFFDIMWPSRVVGMLCENACTLRKDYCLCIGRRDIPDRVIVGVLDCNPFHPVQGHDWLTEITGRLKN